MSPLAHALLSEVRRQVECAPPAEDRASLWFSVSVVALCGEALDPAQLLAAARELMVVITPSGMDFGSVLVCGCRVDRDGTQVQLEMPASAVDAMRAG